VPTAEINPQGTAIGIESGYVERDLIKLIPGSNYSKNRQPGWEVPLTWASCQALRGVFGDKLQLGPRLHVWGHKLRSSRLVPAMQLRTALNFEGIPSLPEPLDTAMHALEAREAYDNPSGRRLYDYQRVDVAYLKLMRRAILANEPGLGKTGVVIRWLQVLRDLDERPLPALVTCPSSLKSTVWLQEFRLWAPEINAVVVEGTAARRRKILASGAEVFIMGYEAMKQHTRLAPFGNNAMTDKEKEPKELNALGLRTTIFDEAHRITTSKSASSRKRKDEDGNETDKKVTGAQTTRAAWALAHDAEFVIPMTGTPIRNNARELWALLHLIDPVAWPALSKWLDRYTHTAFGTFGGIEILGLNQATADELYRTVDPHLRRVPKQAALPQLPPVLPVQYRETPMTSAQATAYHQMRKTMLAELADGSLEIAHFPIEQFTRLNQFALATATTDGAGEVVLSGPSSKVDDLIDVLAEMGDAPLVVAAESRQLIELACQRLEKENISFSRIVGDQGDDERLRAVQRFQDGKVRVILLTLGAGAEGITLTRAADMLFMQESWSLVKNKQARDRIHRIGAEQHAAIRYMVQIAPGTVEENRIEALDKKAEDLEDIVRDRAALEKLLGAA
jgi:SNF2 family DNA or RNA helicase